MARLTIAHAILLLSIPTSVNSLAPSNAKTFVNRREAFGIFGAALTGAAAITLSPPEAEAAALKTGIKSPFTGDYEDPNHPGCLRQVKVVGAPLRGDGTRPVNPVMEIVGYDGNGSDKVCTERPTRADLWKIKGKVKSDTEVLIDFSPKGGPSDLVGKYDKDGIVFPDGNKWTKIPYGTPDRRPKDMSTLTAE
mmetsp:Transcript_22802/g.52264  ORF Transcript_22802/g.52264 Transcript_22802/m.52264 type:complete len:193 (-) Transcript_22802:101-679(-)|eukprot:CAMPEP_0113297410 /NCGR_PEP_ID=MMETSP0010_2-20120614/287_1 /TAXON_ID=216773 ORGANISM="Corethron hystrix, Strain 308" /NCGR_SAMPLE_ID=MMETSP0010_2 /ASSEMBLY_ACC=CAM_ASM_000155 /LENGTH=192 /DNA_ID=CAMNT_0000150301 /DNA_START=67 /DNA_END=645 /DNA_ORIENTATION=+ /assembly_acc=CAM_ASM_000155